MGDLAALNEHYVDAGSDSRQQKDYENVVNPPLLQCQPDELVLDLLPVPQLHLLLGIVDKLLKLLEDSLFPGDKATGLAFVNAFLKNVNIQRKAYQGQHSLEGNQSRALLQKVDQLHTEMEQQGVLATGLPFLHAMKAFSQVVDSCFSVQLQPAYLDSIATFKSAFSELPNSNPTVKLHILFQHVAEFLSRANSAGTQLGLGYWSEQCFEAMHHNARLSWDRVKVASSHPQFGEKLKSFIVSSNSKKM